MSEEKKFYKLVSESTGEAADAGSPAGAPSPASEGEPKPKKIDAPGLLEGFEEDADFDRDPEIERKITGGVSGAYAAPAAPPLPEFVKPGMGTAKQWAIVGCVLLLGAMIATGINSPRGLGAGHVVFRILLTIYNTLINTGTGVLAVYVSARLLENRLGSPELAGSRMFAAVSAFLFVMSLNINPWGPSWQDKKVEELILALAVYVLVVAVTFKLWDRTRLGFVVGFHAVFWLIVQVGMGLQSVVSAAKPAGS